MKPKRVALYMRVSSTHQDVALQRNDLQGFCERHRDWTATEYVDRAVSGTKDRRPALDKLMEDCRRGKIDVVVVWRFDRFARSVSHLLKALEEFKSLGVEFISFTEAIDTSTAMGKMVFTVLGAVAELERSLIVERVRAGQAAAKRAGKPIGRVSAVSPETRALVSTLRSAGQSVRQIAVTLELPKSTVGRMVQ